MIHWIQDPKSVDSLTAMPNVGVTPADARHIAAYLYTLR
jgi:cytochrome c1